LLVAVRAHTSSNVVVVAPRSRISAAAPLTMRAGSRLPWRSAGARHCSLCAWHSFSGLAGPFYPDECGRRPPERVQAMQAIVVEQLGGPEELRVAERPTPQPGPGEIRVEVSVAGVNFMDTGVRRGQFWTEMPLPRASAISVNA